MGLLSDFFGGSARRDLRNAKAAADASLEKGYNDAQGYNQQAYDTLTPWTSQGLTANTTYSNAIGLGSDADRESAQSRYFSDPVMDKVLGSSSNALLKHLNATGQSGGAVAKEAAARVGLEGYNNWLNRLQGLGTQGGQYATGQAGIRQNQGDLAYGYGATKAGNETNFGNAMAQGRSTGINNLMKVAELAANVYTGGLYGAAKGAATGLMKR